MIYMSRTWEQGVRLKRSCSCWRFQPSFGCHRCFLCLGSVSIPPFVGSLAASPCIHLTEVLTRRSQPALIYSALFGINRLFPSRFHSRASWSSNRPSTQATRRRPSTKRRQESTPGRGSSPPASAAWKMGAR